MLIAGVRVGCLLGLGMIGPDSGCTVTPRRGDRRGLLSCIGGEEWSNVVLGVKFRKVRKWRSERAYRILVSGVVKRTLLLSTELSSADPFFLDTESSRRMSSTPSPRSPKLSRKWVVMPSSSESRSVKGERLLILRACDWSFFRLSSSALS
jgi:hypothetical protein